MISPINSHPVITNQPATTTARVGIANPKAPTDVAPYNAMKEKLETASTEAKESPTTKATEAMHQLANAETSKVPASVSNTNANTVATTQVAVQAYQSQIHM